MPPQTSWWGGCEKHIQFHQGPAETRAALEGARWELEHAFASSLMRHLVFLIHGQLSSQASPAWGTSGQTLLICSTKQCLHRLALTALKLARGIWSSLQAHCINVMVCQEEQCWPRGLIIIEIVLRFPKFFDRTHCAPAVWGFELPHLLECSCQAA